MDGTRRKTEILVFCLCVCVCVSYLQLDLLFVLFVIQFYLSVAPSLKLQIYSSLTDCGVKTHFCVIAVRNQLFTVIDYRRQISNLVTAIKQGFLRLYKVLLSLIRKCSDRSLK